CVWQPPNDVSHVAARKPEAVTMGETPKPPLKAPSSADGGASPSAEIAAPEPVIAGPFSLPRDVSDALPLDRERFAVALLTGLEVHNARTGGILGLVTDAPQARRLYRVGPVVYATAPQRIFVVDADTTRLLKTIET